MRDYHVFRKQRVKNGRVIHKWYYYFVVDGKQVQKVCKGCQTKNEAYAFIAKLPELSGGNAILVKTVAIGASSVKSDTASLIVSSE